MWPLKGILGRSSLVLLFLGLPESLAVQSLPRHLHNGLNLWIHIQDASFAEALLSLHPEPQKNSFACPVMSKG